ncbi:hypothetical protein KQX54_015728 [Cotesia glomerata]|uniref:ABC transporter domain-containing protein n=1 Tax=Cotesia glomerata TaxID=32391 RepID=A0AAV7HT65_COTGL|nr:hypothetical protein KQX54_015728 [Cotesia glomerata]
MQDDNLEPLLTVEESVHIAAHLKLGWNNHDKAQRVNEIIFTLGLEACRHTRAAKLSGGQKKRLAIALELVNNLPVMFFDEPASGLDIVTSKQCINLLRALARDGPCTIILTIHQPTGIHLDMIDHLYVVVNGHCVYTGSTKAIVPFLEKHDLHCPTYHNPADFLVEVCNGEYGDWNDKLVEAIDNGKCNDWRSASNKSTRPRFKSRLSPEESEDSRRRSRRRRRRSNQSNDEDDKIQSDKVTEDHCGYYATSFFQQLYILIKRNAIKLSRDRVLTFTRLTMH